MPNRFGFATSCHTYIIQLQYNSLILIEFAQPLQAGSFVCNGSCRQKYLPFKLQGLTIMAHLHRLDRWIICFPVSSTSDLSGLWSDRRRRGFSSLN